MLNSELHQLALSWVGQVAVAASTYGFQLSYLPEEWAEKLEETDLLMQENEQALDKEFPKISAYRKKHFQKIWDIATAAKEYPDALQYMMARTDELYNLEAALEKLRASKKTAPIETSVSSERGQGDPLEELKRAAQFFAEIETKVGFDPDENILIRLGDICSTYSFEREAVKEIVKPILQQERKKRLKEYKSWPAETDCDRLDKAFKALEESGVKAFHHVPLNPSSAEAEILDEMNDPANSGFRGCAWYHFQSTEAAVELGTLRLCYAPCNVGGNNGDEESLFCAVADEIIAALRNHGLTADWSGRSVDQISVHLKWQRRFPT